MGAVGQEALGEAGGGVEDGGGAARGDVESAGYVFGYGAGGDDGDGVVGGADVDEAGEGSDAEFASAFAVNVAGECLDDEVDASVVADDFEHAACQDGHDDEFGHSHHAFVHGREPAEKVVGSDGDADDACEDDADGEDQEHVDSADGEHDDCQIGQHEPEVDGVDVGWCVGVFAQKVVNDEHEYSDWGHDADVDVELVFHAASLCLGGHDGGVADEGEVVAKVCAADDEAHHEGDADARLCGDADSQRCECGDGAATGADAEGDEAGGEEDAWQDELFGQMCQRKVDGGINGSHRFGRCCECAGKDEDGQHQHHCCASGSLRKNLDAFVHRAFYGQQGIDGADQKGDGDGNLVEVLGNDAGGKVEDEKENEWT